MAFGREMKPAPPPNGCSMPPPRAHGGCRRNASLRRQQRSDTVRVPHRLSRPRRAARSCFDARHSAAGGTRARETSAVAVHRRSQARSPLTPQHDVGLGGDEGFDYLQMAVPAASPAKGWGCWGGPLKLAPPGLQAPAQSRCGRSPRRGRTSRHSAVVHIGLRVNDTRTILVWPFVAAVSAGLAIETLRVGE